MIRVRFAPSPTGNIHIGNLRAALFNYIFAKKHKGKIILRFEDTDLERSKKIYEQNIIEDLKWLGIKFDEGPHIGGKYGPYLQSEKIKTYHKYAEKLVKLGLAKKIYEEKANSKTAKKNTNCKLSQLQKKPKEEKEIKKTQAKQNYIIRFFPPKNKIKFKDLVFKEIEKEVEDFIIIKSNGMPTFHLAVVVDDHLMKISHVIRGQDHLSNTVKHVSLAKALNFNTPKYAHYSLTKGLSKRDNSKSIRYLKEKGFPQKAIINKAMLLGWCPKDGIEKFNIFNQLDYFQLSQFSKTNASFDENKFKWLSGQYIREIEFDKFINMSIPYLKAANLINKNTKIEYIKSIIKLMQENITHISQIQKKAVFFFTEEIYSQKLKESLKRQENKEIYKKIIKELKKELSHYKSISISDFKKILKIISNNLNIKGKELFQPIRIIITGENQGPDLSTIANILGKEKILIRINKFLLLLN